MKKKLMALTMCALMAMGSLGTVTAYADDGDLSGELVFAI